MGGSPAPNRPEETGAEGCAAEPDEVEEDEEEVLLPERLVPTGSRVWVP